MKMISIGFLPFRFATPDIVVQECLLFFMGNYNVIAFDHVLIGLVRLVLLLYQFQRLNKDFILLIRKLS